MLGFTLAYTYIHEAIQNPNYIVVDTCPANHCGMHSRVFTGSVDLGGERRPERNPGVPILELAACGSHEQRPTRQTDPLGMRLPHRLQDRLVVQVASVHFHWQVPLFCPSVESAARDVGG